MIEIYYEDYKRLLFKFAWTTHHKTGIEISDLIGEMNVVFCEAFKDWDPEENDDFSSYLSFCCHNRMVNLVRRMSRKKRKLLVFTDEELKQLSNDPEEAYILFDNFVNNPNPVIKEIAKIVLTYSLPSKNMKAWLKKELRKLNFKFDEISEAFKILKTIYDN